MRAVWQRVSGAGVKVGGRDVAQIGQGALVFLGVEERDTERDCRWIAEKCVNLRLFQDERGRFDRSVLDIKGQILLVSQFTLLGDCRKGRRPSFSKAARAEIAKRLYETTAEFIESAGVEVKTGVFQAHMEVRLVNDGPVTVILDSRDKKGG